jgi:hypothetical protein
LFKKARTVIIDKETDLPKRKRMNIKLPLVETEVRRSPRLVILNEGYTNHANCTRKNCLNCNAAPPLINSKVVKNMTSSFCKVDEKEVDRKLVKIRKAANIAKREPGPSSSASACTANKANLKNGKGKGVGPGASGKEKEAGDAS